MTDEMLDQTESQESEETEQEERSRPESVEESARIVFEQLESKAKEDAPQEEVKADEEKPAEEEQTPEQKAAEETRLRDEQGRFKKLPKGKKRQVIEATDLDARNVDQKSLRQPLSAEHILETPPGQSPKQTLEAPAMWPVEDKEWFNQQPEVVQKNALNWFTNQQRGIKKVAQEMITQRDMHAASNQVYENYRKYWPAHMSRHQVDAELYESARRVNEDPYPAVTQILAVRGITPQMMVDYWQKGEAPTNSATQNNQTQNNSLHPDQIRAIISEEFQKNSSQQQNAREAMEVEALRQEKDQLGKYRYPELWDANNADGNYWNAHYLQRLDALTVDLQRTKGLSGAAATKEGIRILRLADGTASPTSSLPSSRLSQQELQTIKAASGSVKSRGNGAIPITSGARKGESVRESAEIVYQHLMAGKH